MPNPSHQRTYVDHVEIRQRSLEIAYEPAEEPWTVLPLERDLLIVDDDGIHHIAAAAAVWPLRTAPSIVAGNPV